MSLKWNTLGAGLLLMAFIFIHSRFEDFSLSIGLSWTFAKISPYLAQFIVIVMMSAMLAQLFGNNFGKKKLILIASVICFSGISFAFNPIYEGDFDNGIQELIQVNGEDTIEEGLTMIALPGCPYCLQRIETLNGLKRYSSHLPIHIIVVGNDSLALKEYSEKLHKDIVVTVAKNPKQLSQLVGGGFPSFLYASADTSMLYYWSQVGFGSGAMDWVSEKH
jgi:hypothetical protein